ncbi:MAG TPA: signal recognition particle receptor subunit alpha, partial [Nannocystis sp.]
MTANEIYLLLAILGVLAVAGGVVFVRRRALPAAKPAPELPPASPEAPAGSTRAAATGPEAPVREDKPPTARKPARPLTPEELARAAEQERYVQGLARTRSGFVAKLARLFRGRPRVSAELRDEIESVLFTADIGAKAAQKLLDQVTDLLDTSEVADADKVWA